MNTIKVINNQVEKQIDKNIAIIEKEDNVKKIIIKILNDTNLEIIHKEKLEKLDIEIQLLENVHASIFDLRENDQVKVQYQYHLEQNSELKILKFNDVKEIKELDIIHLDGENANVNYSLKTIATGSQRYDLILYHHAKNTISNVNNHGVNLTGEITFNVTGHVENDKINCELNQNNRIITLNDKKCTINPILLIDENDVIANHSAYIGKFDQEELFYLQSRGISYEQAMVLLIKGFLLDQIKDERLDKIIEKYWR